MSYYLDAWRHYALFRGRATRPQFWWFFLINLTILLILNVLYVIWAHNVLLIVVRSVYNLAVFLPDLGISTRRLHDTGRSAWWLLLVLLPVIGWIVLWVFYALPSQPGPNAYGQVPRDGGPLAG